MAKALTKQEFKKKVLNDYYERRRLQKLNEADIHNIQNVIKVKEGRRRRSGK